MDKGEMVLVTGADGFVGSRLTDELLTRGYRVRAAVRKDPIPGAKSKNPGYERYNIGSIDARTRWETALDGVKAVIHLAARVHVMRDSSEDPLRQNREINTDGTRRLAEACVASGVGRFVFLSTIKVNGEATPIDRGFTAEDPPAPTDPYAVSKWEAEQALWEIAAGKSLAGVVIRPPLVYGPGVKGNFLRLLGWVWRGVPLPLASVQNRRSYVGLTNLVDLIILCLNHPSAEGRTFLAGDGQDLSTPELIRRLAAAFGKTPRLWPFPQNILQRLGGLMGFGGAVDRLCGSLVVETAKTSEKLGWFPPLRVDDELRDTARWFAETFDRQT